jgi:hypothetical protein
MLQILLALVAIEEKELITSKHFDIVVVVVVVVVDDDDVGSCSL